MMSLLEEAKKEIIEAEEASRRIAEEAKKEEIARIELASKYAKIFPAISQVIAKIKDSRFNLESIEAEEEKEQFSIIVRQEIINLGYEASEQGGVYLVNRVLSDLSNAASKTNQKNANDYYLAILLKRRMKKNDFFLEYAKNTEITDEDFKKKVKKLRLSKDLQANYDIFSPHAIIKYCDFQESILSPTITLIYRPGIFHELFDASHLRIAISELRKCGFEDLYQYELSLALSISILRGYEDISNSFFLISDTKIPVYDLKIEDGEIIGLGNEMSLLSLAMTYKRDSVVKMIVVGELSYRGGDKKESADGSREFIYGRHEFTDGRPEFTGGGYDCIDFTHGSHLDPESFNFDGDEGGRNFTVAIFKGYEDIALAIARKGGMNFNAEPKGDSEALISASPLDAALFHAKFLIRDREKITSYSKSLDKTWEIIDILIENGAQFRIFEGDALGIEVEKLRNSGDDQAIKFADFLSKKIRNLRTSPVSDDFTDSLESLASDDASNAATKPTEFSDIARQAPSRLPLPASGAIAKIGTGAGKPVLNAKRPPIAPSSKLGEGSKSSKVTTNPLTSKIAVTGAALGYPVKPNIVPEKKPGVFKSIMGKTPASNKVATSLPASVGAALPRAARTPIIQKEPVVNPYSSLASSSARSYGSRAELSKKVDSPRSRDKSGDSSSKVTKNPFLSTRTGFSASKVADSVTPSTAGGRRPDILKRPMNRGLRTGEVVTQSPLATLAAKPPIAPSPMTPSNKGRVQSKSIKNTTNPILSARTGAGAGEAVDSVAVSTEGESKPNTLSRGPGLKPFTSSSKPERISESRIAYHPTPTRQVGKDFKR